MKERLKQLDLRLTELAEYLNISRPTLYKFVDYFENGEYALINEKALKLFRYIDSSPGIDKKAVLLYIMTNIVNTSENDFVQAITERKVDKQMQDLFLLMSEHNEFSTLYDTLLTLLKGEINRENIRDDVAQLILCISKIYEHKKLTKTEQTNLEKILEDKEYGKIFRD